MNCSYLYIHSPFINETHKRKKFENKSATITHNLPVAHLGQARFSNIPHILPVMTMGL